MGIFKNNNIILFTGGGSAGHVVPSLPVMDLLINKGYKVFYIGSRYGIEKDIISANNKLIKYYGILVGKFRRYVSFKNIIDLNKILLGTIQAYYLIRKINPSLLFSKGGYVAFPVVVAAWLNKIPIIIHESDLTPGLANKLSYPFANKIRVAFDKTKEHFKKKDKIVITGTALRQEILQGNIDVAKDICKFAVNKPVILVIGGGSGSIKINAFIRNNLNLLLDKYNIVHICGLGNINYAINNTPGYIQLGYIDNELPHILSYADLVISRAGANTIWELIALKKPHILIPLSLKASRGDQIDNARFCELTFKSTVIAEENMDQLVPTIYDVMANLQEYSNFLSNISLKIGNTMIVDLIEGMLP